MQPNYSEQYRKQQEDYQRSRNPFEYGQQVAQRRYSEIMAGLDAQRLSTQQSYGDMYQAARQRAIGSQAMGGPTLSGGMGQQRRDFIGALEMQEMGKIQQAGAKADADLYAQGQAAFSNAQLEGQQATQMEVQNRQTQLQLVQARQAILKDSKLSEAEKQEQLAALDGGLEPPAVEKQSNFEEYLITGGAGTLATLGLVGGVAKLGYSMAAGFAGIKLATGATASAIAFGSFGAAKAAAIAGGAGKVGAFVAAGLATNPVGWIIGAIAVTAIVGGLIYSAVK